MKKITVCMIALSLVGCSSPPKQTEPSGRLVPVYELQHELNERPKWLKDGELKIEEAHNKKQSNNKAAPRGQK